MSKITWQTSNGKPFISTEKNGGAWGETIQTPSTQTKKNIEGEKKIQRQGERSKETKEEDLEPD